MVAGAASLTHAGSGTPRPTAFAGYFACAMSEENVEIVRRIYAAWTDGSPVESRIAGGRGG